MTKPIRSWLEEELPEILGQEAHDCYLAWRKLGRTPNQALAEVERSGLWTDPAKAGKFLKRPVAFYTRRIGNRYGPAEAAHRELSLAGRVLASWQCLTPQEVTWLQSLAEGKALSGDISPAEAQEILAINEQSAKELAEWEAARQKTARANRVRPHEYSPDERACDRYWWRSEPVSYWTAQWGKAPKQ